MNIIKSQKLLEQNYLGINQRNLSYVYDLNPKKYHVLADDKIKSKEIMESAGIACPKTLGIVTRMGDIQNAWNQLTSYDNLVLKPSRGAGGNGIMLLRKMSSGGWKHTDGEISEEQIQAHMSCILFGMYSKTNNDHVLIEDLIESHSYFKGIYPSGVPDIRVIVVKNQAVMAMLRMPTDKSEGKANLHQGGLGIGLDMNEGKMLYAFDGENYHREHPDTGENIYGMHVPYWSDALALALQCSKVFPLDYLGVDIVLDQCKGPMVIEVNIRPGLAIQLANRRGLKTVL